MSVPTLHVTIPIEGRIVLRLEATSAEDEQALLAWVDEFVDLGRLAAEASERLADLRRAA